MEAKPTYHLPPNFSTPPPPQGPFHLGTVLQNFEEKEQMRPLNQEKTHRITIPEKYLDRKGGFTATRKKLKSGELGIWAQFLGHEGIGIEANVSGCRSDFDKYEFDNVETESFYPSSKYISDCLNLSDVKDYLEGSRYREPVYLITGIKVGKGLSVRMENRRSLSGKLEAGVHKAAPTNIQIGPKAGAKLEDEPVYIFTDSSDIVIGIQCLKIYHEKSIWALGKQKVRSKYVTSGAAFYGESTKSSEEDLIKFVAVNPEDFSNPRMHTCVDGPEIWVVPKKPNPRVL